MEPLSSFDIEDIVRPAVDRQIVFDRFLTYRRRMARLASVQALYLYDLDSKIKKLAENSLFKDKQDSKIKTPMILCQEVVYFYKNLFFTPQEYGWNRKNKKVDELFMFEIVTSSINNIKKIDEVVSKHLNNKWTISKLDTVLRAILRSAIGEILLNQKTENAILASEYTNIASNFFQSKTVGFCNGVIDAICKEYKVK
jgi:transcription antitermination factor NusB